MVDGVKRGKGAGRQKCVKVESGLGTAVEEGIPAYTRRESGAELRKCINGKEVLVTTVGHGSKSSYRGNNENMTTHHREGGGKKAIRERNKAEKEIISIILLSAGNWKLMN